jgi:hypothetical protein
MVKLCVCEVNLRDITELEPTHHITHSEVFAVVSLTLFLPICLEQFARDNGFLLPDRSKPCSSASTESIVGRCVVRVGWAWVDSASFRCVNTQSLLLVLSFFLVFMSTLYLWCYKPLLLYRWAGLRITVSIDYSTLVR